jgi:hypothetical protein
VDMLDARVRDGDAYLEDVLLKDLATEALANERALARKDPIITRAVALLVLAVVLELAGVRMKVKSSWRVAWVRARVCVGCR